MHHPRDPPDSESQFLCQRIWNLPTRSVKQKQGWSCHPCKKHHPLHWNPKIQSKWHRISWRRTCPGRPPLASFLHLPPPPPPPQPPPLPPPDKLIALDLTQPTTENRIIMRDFNSHSPTWGYDELDSKGEDVECWATNQQQILINKPQDPPTFYPRSRRITSTPYLAFTTDNIHKLCHREVCSQLGGSNHRPVTILVEQKRQWAPLKEFQTGTARGQNGTASSSLKRKNAWDYNCLRKIWTHNAVQFSNAILRAAKKELQPLLDPTARVAAGSCQQCQGRYGKKPLWPEHSRVQQSQSWIHQRKTPTDKETMVWKDCLPKPGEGLKQTLEPCQSLKWRGSISQQDCPSSP